MDLGYYNTVLNWLCLITLPIDNFPKEQNWRIGICHHATDTSIAIIKTQRQTFPRWVWKMYHKEICDIPKLKNTQILEMFKLFINTIVLCFVWKWMVSQNPHQNICLWVLMIVIKVFVAMCQLPICDFS